MNTSVCQRHRGTKRWFPARRDRHGPVDTEQDTNMNLKWALTRKVIRRYKMKIQWLVLNP